MVFRYKDVDYDVVIVKKNNKNTYVRVKDGCIYITTSYFASKFGIKMLLFKNRATIEKLIDKAILKKVVDDRFSLFGKYYDICYVDDKRFVIDDNKGIIYVKDDKVLGLEIRNIAKDVFYEHLMECYDKFVEDIPRPNLKIRTMKTRWGVCNTKSYNITLNLELVHYDFECLDYVIIHELSHLLEGNHSLRFWNIVARYCPNYKEIRKKLRNVC